MWKFFSPSFWHAHLVLYATIGDEIRPNCSFWDVLKSGLSGVKKTFGPNKILVANIETFHEKFNSY